MTKRENATREVEYACPHCRAGVLQPRKLTYFTTVDGQMLAVPNFPAWVCDICGYVEYDERALGWLYALLSPPMQHRPQRPPAHSTRPRPEK